MPQRNSPSPKYRSNPWQVWQRHIEGNFRFYHLRRRRRPRRVRGTLIIKEPILDAGNREALRDVPPSVRALRTRFLLTLFSRRGQLVQPAFVYRDLPAFYVREDPHTIISGRIISRPVPLSSFSFQRRDFSHNCGSAANGESDYHRNDGNASLRGMAG